MPVAIVTGSGGLVGSECVRHFVAAGFDVVGLENDMRARFFGPDASTAAQTRHLLERYPKEFRNMELDVRDADGVDRIFRRPSPRTRARRARGGATVARRVPDILRKIYEQNVERWTLAGHAVEPLRGARLGWRGSAYRGCAADEAVCRDPCP